MRKPLIGISARMLNVAPSELQMGPRPVQYLEPSVAKAMARNNAIPVLVPAESGDLRLYAQELDGLLLQGGIDICPETYGVKAERTDHPGSRVRDEYELDLLHAFVELQKPVFGICRGMQLINVYYGGTLHEDIRSSIGDSEIHLCHERREELHHEVRIQPGSYFEFIFGPGIKKVNSLHHQSVNQLGQNLIVEAKSLRDDVVEALRLNSDSNYVVGVQWHPELMQNKSEFFIDSDILFIDFIKSVELRMQSNSVTGNLLRLSY